MRVLVTSGATREPIDDVRFVSNCSSGRLGRSVAEALLDKGHEVVLFVGEGALRPRAHPSLDLRPFTTARSLLDSLVRATTEDREVGLLVHAAAVADYAPERRVGKVASSLEQWTLRLRPTPKIADAVRAAAPELEMVLFKLESRVSEDELFRRARATLDRTRARAIVANRLEDVGEAVHRAFWIEARGAPEPLESRAAIALRILDLVERGVASAPAEGAS